MGEFPKRSIRGDPGSVLGTRAPLEERVKYDRVASKPGYLR